MTTLATTDTPLVEILDADGAQRLEQAFGHRTVGDLLHTLPRRFRQRGQRVDRKSLVIGERVTVIGSVKRMNSSSYTPKRGKGRLERVTLVVEDGGVDFEVVFFAGAKIKYMLPVGSEAMFDGTLSEFRGKLTLKHPEFLVLTAATGQSGPLKGSGDLAALATLSAKLEAEGSESLFGRRFLPVYSSKEGVTSWEVFGAVVTALRALVPVVDPLDPALITSLGLMGLDEALRTAHLPTHEAEIEPAVYRLRFDEALALQLLLGARRRFYSRDPAPPSPVRPDGLRTAMEARLPFELTAGQKSVLEDVSLDLSRDQPMNRLLQGEVGSGKTVVALLAMLQVIDSGRQCVMLAPTEVLATQHHRSLSAMLGDLGEKGQLGAPEEATRVVLLTGSMSTAARRQALLDIVTGEAGIVIGTHALIQDSVDFFDLGMVVVDEQHRFGVRQRDRLRAKGRAGRVPHLLVMTATPIPRTIAMTVFGDLEVSELGNCPVADARSRPLSCPWGEAEVAGPGVGADPRGSGRRAPRVCGVRPDRRRRQVGRRRRQWCAVDGSRGPVRPTLTRRTQRPAGRTHARPAAPEEKDAAMTEFASGALDVLVSTTVIEVGVDVPEATVMVVMDAERFGVSQLHQLRGRVGRGGFEGLCLLVTNSRADSRSRTRLDDVAATTDGFVLAQLDLMQRREGDILGDAQSGALSALRILSVVDDGAVIALARQYAESILDADPRLHAHPMLAERVNSLAGSEESAYLERY
ncbi:ATP-dependent DNA helicase RecG [Dietzia aerolata]|uniref:ATP-dependent DNA helicase RecG n=1 Tax=Dietzia aerolata TaxID=595984 RepID=UPI00363E5C5B